MKHTREEAWNQRDMKNEQLEIMARDLRISSSSRTEPFHSRQGAERTRTINRKIVQQEFRRK